MSDSVIDTKAFPLITELKSGVALANALHAHLTDTGCSAAHEQIQALLAATRELAEAVGSELAGIEHYEQGAREAGSLCFWKRCRALRSARGGSSSANGNNVTLI